jgi:WD40 repeat protein
MKYPDGRPVAVGDRVKLWDNEYGVVVCSIDTDAYTEDYPKAAWSYLNSGVLIKTDDGEIFHYNELDEDSELVSGRS